MGSPQKYSLFSGNYAKGWPLFTLEQGGSGWVGRVGRGPPMFVAGYNSNNDVINIMKLSLLNKAHPVLFFRLPLCFGKMELPCTLTLDPNL